MSFALRALMLLAAVTPLVAATAFHPVWWQTLIAAAIGSGLGQLAVRVTRDRRKTRLGIVIMLALVVVVEAAWMFRRPGADDETPYSDDQNWNTHVIGTTPDYFDLMRIRVAAGDRFEAGATENVVVVGDTVVRMLCVHATTSRPATRTTSRFVRRSPSGDVGGIG